MSLPKPTHFPSSLLPGEVRIRTLSYADVIMLAGRFRAKTRQDSPDLSHPVYSVLLCQIWMVHTARGPAQIPVFFGIDTTFD